MSLTFSLLDIHAYKPRHSETEKKAEKNRDWGGGVESEVGTSN